MRLIPDTLRKAEDAAGDTLARLMINQVPIDTGQLRKSLFWSRRDRAVMFRSTIRWRYGSGGARVWTTLKNSQLARILDGKGYPLLDVQPWQKGRAVRAAREALRGRRAFVSAGKAILRVPLI